MGVHFRTEDGERDVTEQVLNQALRIWKEKLAAMDLHLLPYDTLDLHAHLTLKDAYTIE